MVDQKQTGRVLVIGAGVAGIKAAIEVAETGYQVVLTDASEQIGGILAKLDQQFPTDHCGMCRILPMIGREHASQHCLRKSLYHDNIEIRPFTEVTSVEGEAGGFKIGLLKKARHINPDICNGLGKCMSVCPVEVPDEFNHGLSTRKAIYKPVPHNVPQMLLVDMNACTKCGECLKVCPTGAIDLQAEDEAEELEVHAIILASGVQIYDPSRFEDAKSYTVSKDVVSALAFERILCSAGSSSGVIKRPSDGRPAQRMAWIQCMGSRNRRQGWEHCSSICCMFALKEAVLAHEKGGPDIETTIFYMDMRTFGKGCHRYRVQAEEDYGVHLIRCRVQDVRCEPDGTLCIRYFDPQTREFNEGRFDVVVLSTGQVPGPDHDRLSKLLEVEQNASGLLATEEFDPVKLIRPGVFVCGSLMGLSDISHAMSSGIAAAGETTKFLSALDVARVEEELPPESVDKDREQPAVSVVLCRCGDIITAEGVDFDALRSSLAQFEGVGEVHIVDSICREAGEAKLQGILENSPCNRLLIGACLPQVYRKRFVRLGQRYGFNSSLIKVFDLQSMAQKGCEETPLTSWVKRAATDIRADSHMLKYKPPLYMHRMPIRQNVVVVGGGLAGMRAALSLAKRGLDVDLVEKGEQLGGYAGNKLKTTIDGLQPAQLGAQLKQEIGERDTIRVHVQSEVQAVHGSLGDFRTMIQTRGDDESQEIAHGAMIIATGGDEAPAAEYGYGQSDRILTQSELTASLAGDKVDPKKLETVVMIQCVGSRERGGREYCSRICCQQALANALKLKEKNPQVAVYVLCRDVMTYGFYERFYTQARQKGVIFVTYSPTAKPEVDVGDESLTVRLTDHVLGTPMQIAADLLILSTGVVPDASNRELAQIAGVPVNQDGFFLEADPKWRPVEFHRPGLFFAGTAHAPKPVQDVLIQAEAAAHKAFSCLSRGEIVTAREVAKVHDSLCSRCLQCIQVCPYNARSYDAQEDRILVDPAACQACGLCAATCPNGAAEVLGWGEKQILSVIDAKLMGDYSPAEAQQVGK